MSLHIISIFLPLLSFVLLGTMRNVLDRRVAGWLSVLLLGVAATISWIIFIEVSSTGVIIDISLLKWISSGKLDISWGIYLDTISATMLMVVNSVSFLVHLYSIGYMEKDEAQNRFMSYLGLFTFMMLMLISSDNLLQLFFGWEGVGLASYLLIGFWYHKESANNAAIKAFVVNRVGDLFLVAGIALIFYYFGDIHYSAIFNNLKDLNNVSFSSYDISVLEVAGIFLFLGAMGKSAQLGLHTWLPDAMEGPTPVSALIHAATMVTAGVFLVCRMSPLYELAPFAKSIILVVGASTALFAGTIAIVQNDIKRVIAYSTCSQLGYMFAAAGVGAYNAAMFHLMTHAFFKALLFLGAGAVIHAMSHEQDMRKMGGLRLYIPKTYILMIIGSVALIGFPPMAGYFSKDAILEAIWTSGGAIGNYGFWMGITAAVLTALYSGRLLIMTFHGNLNIDEKTLSHVHEPKPVMMLPLLILALGALFAGYIGFDYFMMNKGEFWGNSIYIPKDESFSHHPPLWVVYAPLAAGIIGLWVSITIYLQKPFLPILFMEKFNGIYSFLLNKWYFDEIYERIIVNSAKNVGYIFWQSTDRGIIDRYGPDGIAFVTDHTAGTVSKLNTGYIFNYVAYFITALLVVVSIGLLR